MFLHFFQIDGGHQGAQKSTFVADIPQALHGNWDDDKKRLEFIVLIFLSQGLSPILSKSNLLLITLSN